MRGENEHIEPLNSGGFCEYGLRCDEVGGNKIIRKRRTLVAERSIVHAVRKSRSIPARPRFSAFGDKKRETRFSVFAEQVPPFPDLFPDRIRRGIIVERNIIDRLKKTVFNHITEHEFPFIRRIHESAARNQQLRRNTARHGGLQNEVGTVDG